MLIGAAVIFAIGLIPAFPAVPFFAFALVLGASGYLVFENEKAEDKNTLNKEVRHMAAAAKESEDAIASFQVEPISLEIGYGLIMLVDEGSDNNLISHITSIRKQLAAEMGILVNPIRIRDNLQLDPKQYVIKIKGNQIAKGEIHTNKYLVIDPGSSDFDIKGIPAIEPAFGLAALWIDGKDKEKAELNGYTIVEPVTVLVTHLKELIPDIMTLGEVQKVLQNLLKEHVPVTDLVTILETLADHAVKIKDTEILTEHVRHSLQRTIVREYLDPQGTLNVVTLDSQLEDLIGSNIHKSIGGSIPVLEPEMITRIFGTIKTAYDEALMKGHQAIILASPKVRTALKNLIAITFSNIAVLSLNEIPSDVQIEIVGMVEFR
jgi:flagellar biosynthesis protein FlhA